MDSGSGKPQPSPLDVEEETIEEMVEEPVEEMVEEPVEEMVEESVEEPMEESVEGPVSRQVGAEEPTMGELVPQEVEEEVPLMEELVPQDVGEEVPLMEEVPQFQDEGMLPVSKEEQMREDVVTPPTPQVNLLANLIRWVSAARGKLGIEQLPVFLEVYGISGNLSPELKEVILQLAEVVAQPSGDDNAADVWSHSVLELHGILAGGGTPLHLFGPSWNDEEGEAEASETLAEEDEAEDKTEDEPPVPPRENRPVRLKLVVPIGDGVEKEFSVEEFNINLTPDTSDDGSSAQSPAA